MMEANHDQFTSSRTLRVSHTMGPPSRFPISATLTTAQTLQRRQKKKA
jgi:hypothetical protein